MDYLTDEEDGFLVTGPTLSPENTYILPDGTEGSLCMGAEMDNQILRELFKAVIEAGEILHTDVEFREKAQKVLKRIHEPRINSYGGIMEWNKDYIEKEPGHRHISQLFALYPGSGITPEETPELANACIQTLKRRLENGGGYTGWSCAWIICMYARLHMGEQAGQFLCRLLRKTTYPNLLNVHPPFQIDRNMGGIAAIAEMLLQSHNGVIHILPALPTEWTEGEVKGLMARGGFEISITWSEGIPKSVVILSNYGGDCRITAKVRMKANVEATQENGEILLHTQPGEEYCLIYDESM